MLLLLVLGADLRAQDEVRIRDLDIRIMPSKLDKNLPTTIQSKLDQKVIDIFTQRDIVNQKESTFAVHPLLILVDTKNIEGLVKEVSVQLELGLLVKNIFSGQYLLIFSHKLSGTGSNQGAAINRAISNIRPQRKVYTNFIDDLLQKIQSYYSEECNSIIAKAQRAARSNEFEKAITLLYVLPEDSDCRISNQALLDQVYMDYQRQNCQALTQEATIATLKKDFKTAIELIAQVDPASPCQEEAKALLKDINAKVDEQSAKKMAFLNKVYNDNVEIEKVRQQSMKSISNTYIEGIKKD